MCPVQKNFHYSLVDKNYKVGVELSFFAGVRGKQFIVHALTSTDTQTLFSFLTMNSLRKTSSSAQLLIFSKWSRNRLTASSNPASLDMTEMSNSN